MGSTFLELIRRYSAQVAEGGGYLALVGIGPALLDQLERTGAADVVGRDHIYLAQPALLASVEEAVRRCRDVAELDERTRRSDAGAPLGT